MREDLRFSLAATGTVTTVVGCIFGIAFIAIELVSKGCFACGLLFPVTLFLGIFVICRLISWGMGL